MICRPQYRDYYYNICRFFFLGIIIKLIKQMTFSDVDSVFLMYKFQFYIYMIFFYFNSYFLFSTFISVSLCDLKGCYHWRPLNLWVARWEARWGVRWVARWVVGSCNCWGGALAVALSKVHPEVKQTPGTPRSPGYPLKPGWPTRPLSPIRPGSPSNARPGLPRWPNNEAWTSS